MLKNTRGITVRFVAIGAVLVAVPAFSAIHGSANRHFAPVLSPASTIVLDGPNPYPPVPPRPTPGGQI